MEDNRLQEQWGHFKDRLEFEIGKVEHQLMGVKSRQRDLKRNLWLYIVFAVFPFVLKNGVIRLTDWLVYVVMERESDFGAYAAEQFAYTALVIIQYVLRPIAFLSFPICMYYWIRSLKRFRWHNRKNLQWDMPKVRAVLHEGRSNQAENYYVEQEKLTWVLSRYYLYRSEMDELYRKIESHPPKLTLEQLEEQLAQMEFYEEIRPAREKP